MKNIKKYKKVREQKPKPVKIARQIPRPWGQATRLEHRRVRGKKSGR